MRRRGRELSIAVAKIDAHSILINTIQVSRFHLLRCSYRHFVQREAFTRSPRIGTQRVSKTRMVMLLAQIRMQHPKHIVLDRPLLLQNATLSIVLTRSGGLPVPTMARTEVSPNRVRAQTTAAVTHACEYCIIPVRARIRARPTRLKSNLISHFPS